MVDTCRFIAAERSKALGRLIHGNESTLGVQALIDAARALLDADAGLLTMDESNSTCNERFV